MAAFDELQQKLSATRDAHAVAERELFRTAEQLKRAGAELERSGRWFNARNQADVAQRRALEERQRRLEGLKQQHEDALGRIKGELADLNPAFWTEWTDPRKHADKMNDDIPVALFPLRLETRFKTVPGRAGPQPQLWVRIYPDDCLVDTFEETLSEVEVSSARMFWREYFRAASVENEERAAWRALVASHGSGRASWIVRNFRPLNPLAPGDPLGDATRETKPQSKAAGELILVVSAGTTLTAADMAALGPYWTAVWKADANSALETAALNALTALVGAMRADELATQFKPYNLGEKPAATFTRAATTVRVFFLILPGDEEQDVKTRSWMKAARAELLPERFVLLGYQNGAEVLNELSAPVQAPFAVSPDPVAAPEAQFQFDEHGNLSVGEDLRWMLDFDEAVKRGMGFRVDLTPQLAAGFDRLFVLGIRLGSDAARGKTELESLFTHHYFSRTGFALLPQGSATNNTDDANSAYSRTDDADSSYDFAFKGKAQFTETDDALAKRDGQWFAESLGLDTQWLKQVPHAGGVDQCEARAMNTALWPATLGYFMDTLLEPVFNDDDIYYTRWFFNRFVSGRGMVPAIRMGRQPYGILPTTAFSKIQWVFGGETVSYVDYSRKFQEQRGTAFKDWLWKFNGALDQLRDLWRTMALDVSHVGRQDKDAHQTLLDIVGLHPASVEFHQRYANTKAQEHNIASMWQLFISWQTLPANELHNEAFSRLVELGYTGAEVPLLFDLFWKVSANRLNGPVIQEGALSETDPLRIVTTNNRNYIEWLHEWARVSFDTVRVQDGFAGNQTPNALLYILLKHALELGYYDAGVRALDDAQLLDGQQKKALRAEPHFFQIQEAGIAPSAAGGASAAGATSTMAQKSRYEVLYSPNVAVTGDSRTSLADHLTRGIGALWSTRYLAEQLVALETLGRTPTARLERLLAEHLDCCAYRLDAWMSGLVNFQLASMRYARRVDNEGVEQGVSHRKGIYVGAYGWLENVRPENKSLTPVRLAGELDEIFNARQPKGQDVPLVRDDTNEGYIHAPSVNHAVTAAVLRNGYISNATPAHPELLKVKLSSERVRLALGIIEGIRNGQSLAALLGYQFERGLHDRYAFAESDQFIYPLRRVFPLYTRPEDLPEGVAIEAVEARNVVNGINLIRHVKNASAANRKYPFGFPNTRLPDANPAQQKVINTEVDRLLDLYDALADLAIAEGVHQVVMGNYDRAAATLDAYGQATFPPVPDVVQTPRSGIALTHRIGLQFDANAASAAGDNPRAKAEPAMNQWLAGLLPDAARVGCTVKYVEAATGAANSVVVTQAELGLQPLDLLYIMNPDNLQARSELEDRVRDLVLGNAALAIRPDLPLQISYLEGAAPDYSFFEVAPLLRSLRALLLRSRSLRASDVALPTEGQPDTAAVATLVRSRADFLPTDLAGEKTIRLLPLQAKLAAVFPAAGPVTATILADIDAYLSDIIGACSALARYGLPQTGTGIFHETRGGIFRQLLKKAADIAQRWQGKLDDYDALMLTLPTLAGEPERIELLLNAERLVATQFTDPAGNTSAQILLLVQSKELAFRARRKTFDDLKKVADTELSVVLGKVKTLLPVAGFDVQEVTTEDEEKQIVILAEDIQTRTNQLIDDLDKRVAAIGKKLTDHDGAAPGDKRVQLLTDAARIAFGDDFALVPSFTLPSRQGAEWNNAYAGRELLLDYQKSTLNNDFPLDDWLHGAARVREKMRHIENLYFLAEAFGKPAPELRPVQFPYSADAPWMALEFPPAAKTTLERELLLYTTHYAQDFDPALPQCGLLLDEWTEVVPADTETTGITFHFDKPNSEPPQAILLATPTQFRGGWQWRDLVDTLHETLDMARIRAVEPKQLDNTDLSVFLPATILATTWQPITIAADLSIVNKYIDNIR